jgi:hypothetical protein
MKETKNEKRVINIPKDEFDSIKKHCEDNSLDMVSWIVKNTTEKIAKKIPEGRITAEKAREIYEDAIDVNLPSKWVQIVLDEIDAMVKWAITGCKTEKSVYWDGCVPVTNKYRVDRRIPLFKEQVELIEKELNRDGFTLKKRDGYTSDTRYTIEW